MTLAPAGCSRRHRHLAREQLWPHMKRIRDRIGAERLGAHGPGRVRPPGQTGGSLYVR